MHPTQKVVTLCNVEGGWGGRIYKVHPRHLTFLLHTYDTVSSFTTETYQQSVRYYITDTKAKPVGEKLLCTKRMSRTCARLRRQKVLSAVGVAHGVRPGLALEAASHTEVGELYVAVLRKENVAWRYRRHGEIQTHNHRSFFGLNTFLHNKTIRQPEHRKDRKRKGLEKLRVSLICTCDPPRWRKSGS